MKNTWKTVSCSYCHCVEQRFINYSSQRAFFICGPCVGWMSFHTWYSWGMLRPNQILSTRVPLQIHAYVMICHYIYLWKTNKSILSSFPISVWQPRLWLTTHLESYHRTWAVRPFNKKTKTAAHMLWAKLVRLGNCVWPLISAMIIYECVIMCIYIYE